jgi:NAD(P)-dependent dehydrogenase (short-subunit alcohol dehydrogenase family)
MAHSPVHVVTGGGSGIGAGVCRELAAGGASVVVLDRNLDAAEAVAAEVDGSARQLDVADEDAVERVYAKLRVEPKIFADEQWTRPALAEVVAARAGSRATRTDTEWSAAR